MKIKRQRHSPLKASTFSNYQLLIFALAFAAIGYLIFSSFAATPTKTWDTQTDFNSGTLSNTTATSDGHVTLTPSAVSGSQVSVPTYEFHVEPYNYCAECGDQATAIAAGQGYMWDSYTSPNRDAITNQGRMRVNGSGNSAISPTSNYNDDWWVAWQDYFPSNNTRDSNAGGWMVNFHDAPGDIGWTLSGTGVSGVSSLATAWDPSTDWYSLHVLDGYSAEKKDFNIYQPTPNTWHTVVMHIVWGRVENGITPQKGLVQVWVDGNSTPAVDTRTTPATNTGQAYPDGISTLARPSYGAYAGQLQQYVSMYEGGPYNGHWQGTQPAVHQSTAMLYGPTLAQMLSDKESLTSQWGGILIPGSPVVEPGHPNAYSFAVASHNTGQFQIPSSLASQAGLSGTTYPSSGTITLPFDAGSTVDWSSLTPTQSLPSGTNITYQVRTSSDNSNWSGWTSVDQAASSRYIQVQATLTTSDSSVTPSLDKLVLNYATTETNPPPASNASYLFGNQTASSSLAQLTADKKRGTAFAAPSNATISDIYAYLSGNGTAGTQAVRAAIYAVSGGVPTTLLGSSAEQTVSGTASGSFVRFPLVTPVQVSAGQSYVLALSTGATSSLVESSFNPSGGFFVNDDTYSDGPSSPFGSATTDPRGLVIYAAGTASSSSVPGDLNSDGKVDVTDLSILLSHWNATNTAGDLNGDGRVDILDLSILLANYGR